MVLAGGVAVALLLLIWALSLAERALEPWGDSPRVLYAGVAVVLLGLGTALVAAAVGANRVRIRAWRFSNRVESLLYVLSCLAVTVPLAVGASNSLAASSIGEGGPPLVLVALGGMGLATALTCLMRRGIRLGVIASVILGGALMIVALIVPR